MKREGMVFYRSWLEAIKNLPREIQGEVLTAIIEYGLDGETTESLKPITNAMLAMVKPQIDTNNVKYENGKKGAEHGSKGGRPKKENPNETPQKPQENPNETPKDKDKDKDKDKEEEYKKESTNVDEKEGEPSSPFLDPDFIKFNAWLKNKAPYCSNPKNFPTQITEEDFLKLKKRYTGQEIATIVEQIENRKDLRKKYVNLYRTVLNWAKNEYGK